MESLGLLEVALIVASSVGGAALIVALGWAIPRLAKTRSSQSPANAAPAFLFDGDVLADATLDAQRMLKGSPAHLTEKQAVTNLFQERFPTLSYVMSHIGYGDVETIHAADGGDTSLRIEDVDGKTRVTLLGAVAQDNQSLGETAAHDNLTRELEFLRTLVDTSPHLMWTQDASGKLLWANAAYMQVSDLHSQDSDQARQSWPQQAVFPDLHLDVGDSLAKARRASVSFPDETPQKWFDVTTQRVGNDAAHFASDANAAVVAEQSKIKAMQTSGRLFGNLSTGLAIFDQKRRLTMFNPALTDLTRLKPEFLTGRPTLDMFLDALRESRVLPEPKNYGSWRDQFTALETAAREGTYCENWDSIDGQTFRVTGKPYADQSFVFLFDDITAEVALTRRFRTDIETGQGVMDALPNAIAVFSANSTLLMSNKAYKDLWDSDHDGSMHSHQLRGEIVNWQKRSAAAPAWGDLRTYIGTPEKTGPWIDHLILDDGRHVQCEAQGINGRSTMITFKLEIDKKMAPVIHKLTLSDPSLQQRKS